MRAFKGVVRNGVVELEAGVDLPEGCQVTVTVPDGELVLASIRSLFGLPARARRALSSIECRATWPAS